MGRLPYLNDNAPHHTKPHRIFATFFIAAFPYIVYRRIDDNRFGDEYSGQSSSFVADGYSHILDKLEQGQNMTPEESRREADGRDWMEFANEFVQRYIQQERRELLQEVAE